MSDPLTPEARSRFMASIRTRNTKPELAVRRFLHSRGFRYRLHAKDLPGTPDIVFRSRRKAIFVHGCFWHRHLNCDLAADPKTRKEFWQRKFEANVARDTRARLELERAGWDVIIVWECQVREGNFGWLEGRLRD